MTQQQDLIMQDVLLVLTNVPDEVTAHTIARKVVEARLAACVNVLPAVRSIYRWEGKVEEAGEVTMLIKTVRQRYAALEAAIRESHPYDVPEIIAVPVTAGLTAYLGWVVSETKKDVDV
ncbi:divalent-cation tolerance protein CutA [Noviherbaspirillum denitrificans]|uniref:Cation tolerance protein CutA n=1 Tax=Noviherbaspirillum denitrificans TaxID=1968433 RepID=A0A254THY6_9BURK|nr:divalent-cation tolerance protein CutA [Noviherbaspirillum denitrificans]OWW22256.1 cation tolerance protein CutA [Noviherbaspirillum denitrificans]